MNRIETFKRAGSTYTKITKIQEFDKNFGFKLIPDLIEIKTCVDYFVNDEPVMFWENLNGNINVIKYQNK